MKQKRRKPEEIIRLLRECDGSGLSQEQFCQQKQISIATLHHDGIQHSERTMMDQSEEDGILRMEAGKKVRIFSIYFAPEKGAAPTRISNMAHGLQEAGFDVEVITAMPNIPRAGCFLSMRDASTQVKCTTRSKFVDCGFSRRGRETPSFG